ncbi:MAG TPA: SDR family NAD(P)-dependent oxidoreductase [Dehalococcoidales bacterium]|nr:SDR family NAD(P)-dependent oxidoreductase [Dehalococcoidales bacterium]
MSRFELKGKVAIVTGGGSGIGESIAREFAKVGAKVVVTSRKQENLDRVAGEIKAAGGEALAIATDVRVPEQVENVIKQTVDTFGRLDIMVNNAGAGFPVKIEELSANGWDVIININLKGVFLCSSAAARVMIPQKSGKIINIASVAGINGSPSMSHYGAAKAGVINFTKSCSVEWAQHNINVNCIAPGMIETEGVRSQQILTAERAGDGTAAPALRLPGKVEDIANLAIFLASEEAGHITGEMFVCRGAGG